MKGQDFRTEDKLDANAFNTALWRGLGIGSEPTGRDGRDLRQNRPEILASAQRALCSSAMTNR